MWCVWYENSTLVHKMTKATTVLVYEHVSGESGGEVVRLMPTPPDVSILELVPEFSGQRVA